MRFVLSQLSFHLWGRCTSFVWMSCSGWPKLSGWALEASYPLVWDQHRLQKTHSNLQHPEMTALFCCDDVVQRRGLHIATSSQGWHIETNNHLGPHSHPRATECHQLYFHGLEPYGRKPTQTRESVQTPQWKAAIQSAGGTIAASLVPIQIKSETKCWDS